MRKYNTLAMAQTIKLADWLRMNQDNLRDATAGQAAAQAGAALGFSVVDQNVRSVAKASGLEIGRRHADGRDLGARVARLESRLAKLEEQLGVGGDTCDR